MLGNSTLKSELNEYGFNVRDQSHKISQSLFFSKVTGESEGREIVHTVVMDWSNKLTDSKGEQYCMVMEINKEGITIREQIE
ncbi:hypothetical protein G9A89_012085 [Geosiphon pyriformis]|nr:hypothetical protein G9A89_012085 [Geosiphon pyriformis]